MIGMARKKLNSADERRSQWSTRGAPLKEPMEPRELVLQDDGRILPLTYGMDRAWTVADLSKERLSAGWTGFMENRWPDLRRCLRRACVATARGRHGEVVAWRRVLGGRRARHAEGGRAAPLAPTVTDTSRTSPARSTRSARRGVDGARDGPVVGMRLDGRRSEDEIGRRGGRPHDLGHELRIVARREPPGEPHRLCGRAGRRVVPDARSRR